jgi:hypothetical protein
MSSSQMSDIFNSMKTAVSIAAGTITTGLGSAMDIIPTDIGKLSALAGTALSLVLIYIHLKKRTAEARSRLLSDTKLRLEIGILRAKEAEAIKAAEARKGGEIKTRRGETDGGG